MRLVLTALAIGIICGLFLGVILGLIGLPGLIAGWMAS
jgi:hypothetical protein